MLKRTLSLIGLIAGIAFFLVLLKKIEPMWMLPMSWIYVGIAIFLSMIGFVFQSLSWWMNVKAIREEYPVCDAINHHGSTIFTKYIPGKIVSILGRAALASKGLGCGISILSFVSLLDLILSTFIGGLIGSIILLFFTGFDVTTLFPIELILVTLLLVCVVSIVTITLVTRKIIANPKYIILSSVNFIICWGCWVWGFSLLVLGFYGGEYNTGLGALFALATTVGILIIIVPGGIGVREGMLVAGLILVKFDPDDALFIAVLSRLWFMAGEVFIFIISTLMPKPMPK